MSSVLDEQQVYYNKRAAEYDEWWDRKGQYDQGEENNRMFFDDRKELETNLLENMRLLLKPDVKILELACGTGNFTRFVVSLFSHKEELHLIDGSQEMLNICMQKIGDNSHVKSAQKRDLLSGEPFTNEQFDIIFFSFFLSHVPDESFTTFLNHVRNQTVQSSFWTLAQTNRCPPNIHTN
jgi:demethylmenaquinone methyltransferase/2-methoxy-6-polyprenyl-1,4-benzoquinol methylase